MKDHPIGTIITAIIMLGIVWIVFASLDGGADYSNQQDPCDGSSRSVCP